MSNSIIDFTSLINSDNTVDFEAVLQYAPAVFKKLIFAKNYITIKVEDVQFFTNDKTIVMYRKYKNLTNIQLAHKFGESSCLLSCFMDYFLKPEFNKFLKESI